MACKGLKQAKSAAHPPWGRVAAGGCAQNSCGSKVQTVELDRLTYVAIQWLEGARQLCAARVHSKNEKAADTN
jgi:hypothetical protein